MWSGTYSSTHDFGSRGPGFDSHPEPEGIFGKLSFPFFQTTDLILLLHYPYHEAN